MPLAGLLIIGAFALAFSVLAFLVHRHENRAASFEPPSRGRLPL